MEVLRDLWDRGEPAARRPRRRSRSWRREVGGVRVPHRAHGLHRRARGRADRCPPSARARSSTRSCAAASTASCRAASARATRCGSRSATRCTATTSRRRRTRSRRAWAGSARSTSDFTGADVLRRDQGRGAEAAPRGLRMLDRAIPRAGYPLLHEGEQIGAVTSGTLSPSLDRGIGLGYLRADLAAPGERRAGRRPRPPCATRRSRRSRSTGRSPSEQWRPRRAIPTTSATTRSTTGCGSRGRGRLRDHVVRAGRARGGRLLRAAGGRRPRRGRRAVRRARVGEGRVRRDRAPGGRGRGRQRRRGRVAGARQPRIPTARAG